jgi:isopentenyldiphosphate isomerase
MDLKNRSRMAFDREALQIDDTVRRQFTMAMNELGFEDVRPGDPRIITSGDYNYMVEATMTVEGVMFRMVAQKLKRMVYATINDEEVEVMEWSEMDGQWETASDLSLSPLGVIGMVYNTQETMTDETLMKEIEQKVDSIGSRVETST